MAIQFLDCTPEHLGALRRFWTRVYRPDYVLVSDERLFDWQFRDRTQAGDLRYTIKLAFLDGELAGCLGYLPVEANYGRDALSAAWVVNWMVDPACRRLGLGPFLMREVTRQFDLTLNIGPNAEASTVLTKMGWADFGFLTRFVAVFDKAAVETLVGVEGWRWSVEATKATYGNAKIIERFGADSTKLWDEFASSGLRGVRRSAEYLNWRYLSHPTFDYRAIGIERGGALRGYAIYRIEQVRDLPFRVGRVMEMVSSPEVAEDLLASVIAAARREQLAFVDYFCSQLPNPDLFIRCGFLSGEQNETQQVPMLFQPLDRRRSGIRFMAYRKKDLLRDPRWFVTKGDGDQDRPN